MSRSHIKGPVGGAFGHGPERNGGGGNQRTSKKLEIHVSAKVVATDSGDLDLGRLVKTSMTPQRIAELEAYINRPINLIDSLPPMGKGVLEIYNSLGIEVR